MRKLKLQLAELKVASFETSGAPAARGTVDGRMPPPTLDVGTPTCGGNTCNSVTCNVAVNTCQHTCWASCHGTCDPASCPE